MRQTVFLFNKEHERNIKLKGEIMWGDIIRVALSVLVLFAI